MKLLFSLYLGLMMLYKACEKPDKSNEPKPLPVTQIYYKDSIVPIIWQTAPDLTNKRYAETQNIFIYNNQVYTTENGKMVNYNIIDGSKIDNIPNVWNSTPSNSIGQFFLQQNNVLRTRHFGNGMYFNLTNNSIIKRWTESETFEYCNEYLIQNPNKFYHFYSNNTDSSLNISKINNGIETTVFRDTSIWKNNYIANIGLYEWTDPSGNDYLVICPQMLERFGTLRNKTDIVLYNLNTKQIEWRYGNLDFSGLGGGIVVHDNKFYCFTPSAIQCYDLISKTFKWEYNARIQENDTEGFGGGPSDFTPLFFDSDKMYFHGVQSYAYCVNKNTGSVIWKNAEAGGQPGYKQAYNGVVYFRAIEFNKNLGGAGANIIGIRKSDGQVVFSARSPDNIRSGISKNGESYQGEGIAIDSTRGWLVAFTNQRLVCLDIHNIH